MAIFLSGQFCSDSVDNAYVHTDRDDGPWKSKYLDLDSPQRDTSASTVRVAPMLIFEVVVDFCMTNIFDDVDIAEHFLTIKHQDILLIMECKQ